MERLCATPAALALVQRLEDEHGALLLYQSGGCCEGSTPLCLRQGELQITPQDVLLGQISNTRFYTSPSQFTYLQYSHLTLDVVPGRGDSFSLEAGLGYCFIILSRLFSDTELLALEAQRASA